MKQPHMDEYFIDKLAAHQEHFTILPLVGRSICIEEDLATGEILTKSPKSLQQEGSYSSKIIIRCNGSRVEVSGNPSRYGRIDNLFGFKTIDDCIRVFNILLAKHNLPPFTKCTRVWHGQSEDGTKARVITDGAVITQIDWTRNRFVGQNQVKPFLRGISSQTLGRSKVGHLYSNGCTVNWGEGSQYKLTSIYDKANDLKRHKKSRLKDASDEDIKYYDDLILFCENYGVAREEHKFKRLILAKKNLRFYGLIKEEDFLPHLMEAQVMIDRCSGNITFSKEKTIADQLIDNGVVKSRQAANATQCYANMWMNGQDIRDVLSRSNFQVHKGRLKQIGLDIAIPFDVTRRSPTIIQQNVIKVSDLHAPTWYRPASVSHLRLVS